MPYIEHVRDTLTGSLTDDYLQQRIREGWKPVLLEWEREVAGEQREAPRVRVGTPYGLRVADDCLNLEQDPAESSVLGLLLELVREEGPFSRIAAHSEHPGFSYASRNKMDGSGCFQAAAAPDRCRSRPSTGPE